MDTTKPSFHSSPHSALASPYSSPFACPADALSARLLSNEAPLVIDVRKNEAYLASNDTLPGAIRRDPFQVDAWANALPKAASVLVYCVHGHEVSMNTMLALRAKGINAQFLEGGIESWREQGLPLNLKQPNTMGSLHDGKK